MHPSLKPIHVTIDGCSVVMQSEEGKNLPNSWSCVLNEAAFLRSGNLISQAAIQAFYHTVLKLKSPLRAVSCQVCSVATEWDLIASQHLWLTWLVHEYGLSAQIAPMLLPTEHVDKGQEESEFTHRALDKLSHLHNIDAWQAYCYWMTEEIEAILAREQVEAVDIYTLEANFKDYIHEERCTLLRNNELEVIETILKLGALRRELHYPLKANEDVITLEKSLVKARLEAKERMIVQYHSLEEMSHNIGIIESAHPELIRLKRIAMLLVKLLGSQLELVAGPMMSWGQQLMVMQLLHEEMGIISTISGSGLEHTRLAFAVQLATSLTKQSHGVDAIMDLALHWDEKQQLKARAALADHMRHTVAKLRAA